MFQIRLFNKEIKNWSLLNGWLVVYWDKDSWSLPLVLKSSFTRSFIHSFTHLSFIHSTHSFKFLLNTESVPGIFAGC